MEVLVVDRVIHQNKFSFSKCCFSVEVSFIFLNIENHENTTFSGWTYCIIFIAGLWPSVEGGVGGV